VKTTLTKRATAVTIHNMINETQLLEEFTWRDTAACLKHPATLFFGFDDLEPPGERRNREDRAKLICSGCLVKEECLDYALAANESYGIWGGLTEVELKAYKRALKNRSPLSI
jgi:WhiB family transcriptional regulator, redox-sensing transcriptional regulator